MTDETIKFLITQLPIIIAAIGSAAASVVAAVYAMKSNQKADRNEAKLERVHKQINSRFTQAMRASNAASFAAGEKAEKGKRYHLTKPTPRKKPIK